MIATKEQLRFNLDVAPDPENMTTRFRLRHTPVVIKKVPPSSSGEDDDEPPLALTLDPRMELASRLCFRFKCGQDLKVIKLKMMNKTLDHYNTNPLQLRTISIRTTIGHI